MKVRKRSTSSFLQGNIDDVLELFAKNDENKANYVKRILLKILNWCDLSMVEPFES